MPEFSPTKYADFGVDEPATDGEGASQYLFAVATALITYRSTFRCWEIFCFGSPPPVLLHALIASCEAVRRGQESRRGSTSALEPSC